MQLFSVASLLAIALSTVNAIIVNTPTNVVQCQPVLITWDLQGAAGPVFLSVVPGASPTSPALVSWSNLTGTSISWTVTQPAGTSLDLLIRDGAGGTAQSAVFTVQAGSDASCLTPSSLGSSLAVSSLSNNSTVPSVASSATIPRTTTTPTATKPPSTNSPSTNRPTSTTTPGSTANGSTSGALSNVVNFGSVGFLAVLLGAILA